MSQLGELAEELIETEFSYLTGSEQTSAINRASGWMEVNLGKLNTLLFTSFSGVDPDLKQEEEAIYKQIYLVDYWKSKVGSVLKNADSSTSEWLVLREGDSSIEKLNKNEVAKTYRGLSSDASVELDRLVHDYKYYQASPRQVDVINYPSGDYPW